MDDGRKVASTPPAIERRTLPNVPWVSLAEALTWIAFGDAMTPDRLRAQVEGPRPPVTDSPEERLRKFFAGDEEDVSDIPGLGYFHDRQSGLETLSAAWCRLRQAVDYRTVKLRGRFTPTYSLADARIAETVELTGNLVATFSQFDVSTGGIRRQPLESQDVLWQDDPRGFDRESVSFGDDERTADGYLIVEVEQAALLDKIPANEARNKSNVAIISKVQAENECQRWLLGEFANDPNNRRTKADFERAALENFSSRLSQRGFKRAWAAVAPGSGRSGPGRKS